MSYKYILEWSHYFIFTFQMIKKTLILLITTLSILSFSFAQSTFESDYVNIGEDQEVIFTRIIDNTYTPFLRRNIMDNDFKIKLWTIRNTLVQYLNNNFTTDTVFFALEYLIFRIEDTLDTAIFSIPTINTTVVSVLPNTITTTVSQNQPISTPTAQVTGAQSNPTIPVTTNGASTTQTQETVNDNQTVPTINISNYYEGDKNILAGNTSDPVFKYELVSSLEWAIIEELAFLANIQDLEKSVESVLLFDEQGILIDQQRPRNNIISFPNINRQIPEGQSELYVVIQAKKIWLNSSAPQQTSFNLNLDIQESTWSISWRDLAVSIQDWNDTVTIVPTTITHILLTDQRESRTIDTRLISWDQDLAILVIWAKSWDNTESQSWRSLDTIIERISIIVDDNTTFGNAAFNMSISKLNSEKKAFWSLQNWTEVIFDLNELGNDAIINDQEEVAFIISWEIPSLDPTNQESVSIRLTSTDNWWVFMKTTDPASLTISDLNLRTKVSNRISIID